jgi:hypothetical protein
MSDVRKLFDKAYIYAYDLEGRDVTVTIERVIGGTLVGTGGKSNKKPIVYFKGTEKGLALNITNARTIAGLYGGFDSEAWIGKKITLYATTTSFGSQTVDCIRVRNLIPKGKSEPIRTDVPAALEGADGAAASPDAPPLTADQINFGGAR